MTDSDSSQTITLTTLRELYLDDLEEDLEVLEEIVEIFLEEMPKRLIKARDALASGDARSFNEASHSMKSSSNYLGAHSLAEVCLEAEMLGRRGALTGADELLEKIEELYAKVEKALANLPALIAQIS